MYQIKVMRDGVSVGQGLEVVGDMAAAEQMARNILKDCRQGTAVIVYQKNWMGPDEQVASFWVPRVPGTGSFPKAS